MRVSPQSSRGKLILIFASVHLVFLLFGILPVRWRDKIHVTPVFSFYERLTRCHQFWNIFETIPNMNRLEARLVVKEGTQKAHEEGVILPGLRRFSPHEYVRLNNWIANVIFTPSRGVLRESYMKKAAAALLRSGRYGPSAQVSLEVIPAYTRSLLGVRTFKEIAIERPSVLGPFELAALVSKDPPTPPAP